MPAVLCGLTFAPPCSSAVSSRRSHTTAQASAPSAAAPSAAVRQPAACAMPVRNTGAMAQPRLPERPCAEKAWPSRAALTLRLSTVKSAGWNTLLPRPASAPTASSMA
ncbi:MAG: hypothetical protein MOGDAGHF_02465 [Rhodocyclaceae bacterium]|nr:hypothetical protein [Rhodocyclaceae bacterium]